MHWRLWCKRKTLHLGGIYIYWAASSMLSPAVSKKQTNCISSN
jgi:hypothetical protein